MKNITDIFNINESKAGELKKLYMLEMMVLFDAWEEFGIYKDIFEKTLSKEETEQFKNLYDKLNFWANGSPRIRWSAISEYFPIINKVATELCGPMKDSISRYERMIWKDIKEYTDAN